MNHKTLGLLLLLPIFSMNQATAIHVSKKQALQIGKKIWKNECAGTIEGLTHWIKGEPCASLGIGHFIWYPKNTIAAYTQTFPQLLSYFQQHKITLPKWLEDTKNYCPWHSYEDFITHKNSAQMKTLQTLLANHIDLQTQFIVDRLINALPTMLNQVAQNKRSHIKKQFYRVARSENGLYALIDYINFKGEGVNPGERYNNQGWGLLQVLEYMNGTTIGHNASLEFSQAAAHILKKRVDNAPKHNTLDKKCLPGWLNRVKTYIKS